MRKTRRLFPAMALTMVLACLFAQGARADSCYETKDVDVNCNPKTPGAGTGNRATPTAPVRRSTLRDEVARAQAAKAEKDRKIADAKARWRDAHSRAQHATDSGKAAGTPQEKAGFRNEYERAMRDLRRAGNDLMAVSTDAEKAQVRAAMAQNEAQGAAAAADAFSALAVVRAESPPPPPAAPDNVAMSGDRVMVCDGAIQGVNVSCRVLSRNGQQCTSVIASDGVIGWSDSISTPCSQKDSAQGKAFLDRNPEAATAVAKASHEPIVGLGDIPFESRLDIRPPQEIIGGEALDFLKSLSPECQKKIADYVAASENRDSGAMAAGYQSLQQDCQELVRGLGADETPPSATPYPQRRMGTLTQGVFASCFDQPERCAAAAPSTYSRAGMPDDFLDNLIGLLGAAHNALGAAQALNNMRLPNIPGGTGGIDMSTINRRARSTYGNGTPTPAPRTGPSDITGTGR